MNKKKSQSVVNIGSSSLLVIFLILCLVIFAVLTLTSANSDYRFSKRIADRNTAYYEAVAKAELTWNDLDLAVAHEGGSFAEKEVHYEVPIDDSQELQVVLTLAGNETSGYHYDISKWETHSTKEWTGDNSLNLIQID